MKTLTFRKGKWLAQVTRSVTHVGLLGWLGRGVSTVLTSQEGKGGKGSLQLHGTGFTDPGTSVYVSGTSSRNSLNSTRGQIPERFIVF